MVVKRNACTGPALVHGLFKTKGVAAAVMLSAASLLLGGAPADARSRPAPPPPAPQFQPSDGVANFYRDRGGRPLWLAGSGAAATELLALLDSAAVDGLNPHRYSSAALAKLIHDTPMSNPAALERTDMALSRAFATYVQDLRRDPGLGTVYVDRELAPAPVLARAVLDAAANAPSLDQYLRTAAWMNPIYGQLRQTLTSASGLTDQQRKLISLNLVRARTLPSGNQRYVLVNAAAQRLYMYDNGQVIDSMRVVVGKKIYPTPVMSAFIKYASLNPYWYVPPDLTAERIAPNVLKQGMPYLKRLGYQVLSDFSDTPMVVDPATVDWKAVADRKTEILVRQLPGPHNSMGRMKFMFPNGQGIYLHDNPERELFSEASRLYSGGCVRLEDAARLGQWMFGRPLEWKGAATEQKVPLDAPVPVYITYLTAIPDGSSIAYLDDVYDRDGPKPADAPKDAMAAASTATQSK